MDDIAFDEALNLLTKFPEMESSSQTMPSAPAV